MIGSRQPREGLAAYFIIQGKNNVDMSPVCVCGTYMYPSLASDLSSNFDPFQRRFNLSALQSRLKKSPLFRYSFSFLTL